MLKLVTFGLLCAAALVAAAHAREDRRCVLIAAGIIAGNWLLFAMPWIYNPLSLAHMLKVVGFPARHEDIWALVDVLSLALLAHYCRHLWWSATIAAAYLGTLVTLWVGGEIGLDYDQYEHILDAALVMQLAVVLTLGGGGIADLLSDCGRRARLFLLGRPPVASAVETPR